MRKLTRMSLGLVLAVMIPVASAASSDAKPATPQQVRELIHLSGTAQRVQMMSKQMVKMLAAMLQQRYPCVPQEAVNGMFDKKAQQDLIERMVPVYQKLFTQAEMAQLLKFYRGPIGRKLTEELPKVMQEAMQIGREWGRQRAEAMFVKLRQDGTLDANGQCPATGSAKPAKGGASL